MAEARKDGRRCRTLDVGGDDEDAMVVVYAFRNVLANADKNDRVWLF